MEDQIHTTGLPFWKYHGTGNDFVMLDNLDGRLTNYVTSGLARRLCDRHLGVGGDGLIVLERAGSGLLDFRMQYYNSDGSTGALCGNGARCAVVFALDLDVQPSRSGIWRFHVQGQGILEGFLTGSRANGVAQIAVRMPDVDWVQVVVNSGYFVHTGCPHLVMYVENEAVLDRMDVLASGSALRNDARFRATAGTNVDFVCPRADDTGTGVIRVRTFERGVEAETLSCGTGAVAVALVDVYRKLVETPQVFAYDVTNAASGDVCNGSNFFTSDSDVTDIDHQESNVIPHGDAMGLRVAGTSDVTSSGDDVDVIPISTDVNVPVADVSAAEYDVTHTLDALDWRKTNHLNPGVCGEGCYVRHVVSKGGRLTVTVECRREQTTGRLLFRNIRLSGPTTKVFRGIFFLD